MEKTIPFVSKVRKQATSFIITIPRDAVEKANIKEGDIPCFTISNDSLGHQYNLVEDSYTDLLNSKQIEVVDFSA